MLNGEVVIRDPCGEAVSRTYPEGNGSGTGQVGERRGGVVFTWEPGGVVVFVTIRL